jgi:hypothetical protein
VVTSCRKLALPKSLCRQGVTVYGGGLRAGEVVTHAARLGKGRNHISPETRVLHGPRAAGVGTAPG